MMFYDFLKRDFLIAVSYKFPFFIQFIGIFFSMFIFFFVSKLVGSGQNNLLAKYSGNYFSFLLVGIAFSDFFLNSINSFSEEIRKGQLFGTLEALLTAPISITRIVIYSSVFNYLFSGMRFFLYFLFGKLFFDVSFGNINISCLAAVLILSLLSFWGIGMISATFVIIFKQGSPIKWLLGPATGLLGGIFYPLEVLPESLRHLAYLLPITHSVEAIRLLLFKNADFYDISFNIISLTLLSVLLFPLGIYLFKLGLNIAKRQGSLLHY